MVSKVPNWIRKLSRASGLSSKDRSADRRVSDEPGENSLEQGTAQAQKAIHVNRRTPEGIAALRSLKRLGQKNLRVVVVGPAGAGKKSLYRKVRSYLGHLPTYRVKLC